MEIIADAVRPYSRAQELLAELRQNVQKIEDLDTKIKEARDQAEADFYNEKQFMLIITNHHLYHELNDHIYSAKVDETNRFELKRIKQLADELSQTGRLL